MQPLRVEVIYALADQQITIALELEPGASVRKSIVASGLLESRPEIDIDKAGVGVWGQRVALDHALRDGDRVEIYRPLIADPKVIRRQRARAANSTGRRKQG
jgi:putative ubiquitin-RnfH superfamily antitoxin RatB of RatAB toxin-antitoxin module